MNDDKEFKEFMRQVDNALVAKCGMTHHDLSDFCYRDAFESGENPSEVADEVLEEEGFYDFAFE